MSVGVSTDAIETVRHIRRTIMQNTYVKLIANPTNCSVQFEVRYTIVKYIVRFADTTNKNDINTDVLISSKKLSCSIDHKRLCRPNCAIESRFILQRSSAFRSNE